MFFCIVYFNSVLVICLKNVKFNVDYFFLLFKMYLMYKYEEVMYGGKISNKLSFFGCFVYKIFNVFNIFL